MRWIFVATTLAVSIASPASAKGPAITWEITPSIVPTGSPVTITARFWDWNDEGEPDLTSPFRVGNQFMDSSLDRLVPAGRPTAAGISLGRLERSGPAEYGAELTLKDPGQYELVREEHWFEADGTERCLREVLATVRVLPANEDGGTEAGAARASLSAALLFSAFLVTAAWTQRRRWRKEA